MNRIQKIKRLMQIFKDYGLRGIEAYLRTRTFLASLEDAYKQWIEESEIHRETDQELSSSTVKDWTMKPLISLVLPVYNVDEKWLRKCVDSVRAQAYTNWELCIADDASTAPHIRPILENYSKEDPRIKVVFRKVNGHISAASNSAFELATGEFCVLLDHDDELTVDALFWVAKEIADHPETAMIYSDEDLIDERGKRTRPKFKPDFSRDLMYSLNLVTHLSAYRTSLIRETGGFREGLEGSQDYDLALRIIERIDEEQIRHIPRILYHWRAIRGSVAFGSDEKPYAHERAREAIRQHFERTDIRAKVEQTHFNLHRLRYVCPEPMPQLSVIVWDRNRVATPEKQIDPKLNEFGQCEIVLTNASKDLGESLNEAVSRSTGSMIIFLRSGAIPDSDDLLNELVSFAIQPAIGCAGGLTLAPDGTVTSGGIILGGTHLANVAHTGLPEHFPGNMIRNLVASNFSAVSIDALAIRRELFDEIGGFGRDFQNPRLLAADLCLRLRERDLRIVLTPYAKFRQPSKGKSEIDDIAEDEQMRFRTRWANFILRDPFNNPNLTDDGKFGIKC
jgi:cellulose synthase/poly-beta-1,6-N-acetylglucosamine synthase-like glycosyltransferase